MKAPAGLNVKLMIFLALFVAMLLITPRAFAVVNQPSVLINNGSNISLKQGDTLTIPLVLQAGSLASTPVNYFLWVEKVLKTDGSAYGDVYFTIDSTGFVKHPLSSGAKAGPVTASKINAVTWSGDLFTVPDFRAATGVDSFDIFLCLDKSDLGAQPVSTLKSPTNTDAICGTASITTTANCEVFKLNPPVIDISYKSAAETTTSTITVTDCSNNPVSASVEGSTGWLNAYSGSGVINLHFYTTDTSFDKTRDNKATLKITYNNTVKYVNVTVRAESSSTTSYTITASQTTGGTIACTPVTVASGGSSTCTVTPNTGYTTQGLLVDGVSVTAAASHTFTNVTVNHTISATFTQTTTTTTNTGAGCYVFGVNICNNTTTTCTPKLSVYPNPIYTTTTTAGAAASTNTLVTNYCNASVGIPFSAQVLSYSSGSGWLTPTASGNDGALRLTFNTTGMSAGNYTATVRVTSTSFSDQHVDITVPLTIEGPCVAASAVISPNPVTQTVASGANAASVNVTVKDNCGSNLSYTLNTVSQGSTAAAAWLTTTPAAGASAISAGTTLVVSFASSGLPAGSYSGSLNITPAGYAAQSVSATLTVSPTATANTGGGTLLKNTAGARPTIGANSIGHFYFQTQFTTHTNPLQIVMSGQTNYEPNVDMVARYSAGCDGIYPTAADLQNVVAYCAPVGCTPSYSSAIGRFSPFKYGDTSNEGPSYYGMATGVVISPWYYAISGDSFEGLVIDGPSGYPKGCYYISAINNTASPANIVVMYQE